MMNKNKFMSLNFQYMINERVKRYWKGKTFNITLLRGRLDKNPYSNEIIVTPYMTYIPLTIMTWIQNNEMDVDEFLYGISTKFISEFPLKPDEDVGFDKDFMKLKIDRVSNDALKKGVSSGVSATVPYHTDPMTYYLMFMSSDSESRSNVSRYLPLMCEKELWMDILNTFQIVKFSGGSVSSEEDLDYLIKLTEDERKEIMVFYQTMFRTGLKEEELKGETIHSDFKTSLSQMMEVRLTYDSFNKWERSRHNIFGQVCMRAMGLDTTSEMDVDVSTKYNYMGQDYEKTPDMIDDEKMMIIDFAVTTRNAGEVREEKMRKYDDLKKGLSDHMQKEFKCEAIVWKIINRNEFQIPQEYRGILNHLKESEELDFLHEMHMKIIMMKDYTKFKRMSDRKDEDGTSTYKEEMYKKLVMMKVENKKNFMKTKAVDICESRTSKRGPPKKKLTLLESDFHKDLAEMRKLNEDDYIYELKSLMEMKIKTNDMPKYMDKILNPNFGELENMIKKQFTTQKFIRKKTMMHANWKIPKLFKFPLFANNKDSMPAMYRDNTPDFFGTNVKTKDGTLYYDDDFGFEDEYRKEMEEKKYEYNTDGIGIDREMDSMFFDNILMHMLEESDHFFENPFDEVEMESPLRKLMFTNMWMMVTMIADLYLNISYLEGRRHTFNSKDGMTVFRNCGSYFLMIKRGSKLTSQKQIRYKVFYPKKNSLYQDTDICHGGTTAMFHEDFYETKWLSCTITDIRHFLKVKEVTMGLMSEIYDKEREMDRGTMKTYNLANKSNMAYIMIMLENKRGTSTSLQLNRYLMHSITSYISNKEELIKDINSSDSPIRSRGEAYVRICQMEWYEHMIPKSSQLSTDRVLNMTSTNNDYDRFYLPSFFDLDHQIEFSIMMDEIYLGNLFDKEAGFNSHRLKQVVKKQETAEMHFQKVRSKPESSGKIDNINSFLNSKDELHMFDRKFVVSASKRFFNNKVNKLEMHDAMLEAMSATIDEAMMMTSSLVSGPYYSEAMEFTKNIVKKKTFLTLHEEVKKMSTNMLVDLCNKYDTVDAIFALFPKSQIGGPREILIQAVMLRIMVKFLETVSLKMCTVHEKEMITKSSKRSDIQSDKMAEMRENMRILRSKGESAIHFSLNSDASKWAPGFVMENFMYFVDQWDLPEELKNLLLTIIMSFSSKRMLLPESLKKKWDGKDRGDKELSEAIESCRNQAYDNAYAIEYMSGMGQGMFHKLSSLYHVVCDDLSEEVIKDVLFNVHKVVVNETTLISSDDKTKLSMMLFKKGPENADEVLRDYIKITDLCSRLGNIHINWKKSGLNFIITEFNSLFSVGKRMVWATIKDIYTSNSIPDLTSPEEAVTFMLSNIRRCLEHGVYLSTTDIMIQMARKQLITYYRITPEIISNLMKELDCDEDFLPFSLGFFPRKMPVESMIYGMEVHMFDPNNSPTLDLFYDNMFRASSNKEDERKKKTVPFSEDSKGKFWFELPTRLDKLLVELKNEFFEEKINITYEEIINSMDRSALNVNALSTDFKRHKQFVKEFFVGMNRKFEFQETMVVHSLVRALQMSRSKGVIFPRTQEAVDNQDKLREMDKAIRKKILKGEEVEKDMDKFKEMEEVVSKDRHDILSFTRFILSINTNTATAKVMYKGLSKVAMHHSTIRMELEKMNVSYRYYHPTMKTIRFYTNDIGVSVRSEELLNHMFDPSQDSSTSMVVMIHDLTQMTKGYEPKDVYQKPFEFIEELMKNSNKPFKDFKDFLDLNYKSMKFVKINMISDFFDGGNMEENLLNMYRTRVNPSYILEKNEDDITVKTSILSYLSNISLGIKNIPQVINDDMCKITMQDNKMSRVMKLDAISRDTWTESTTMEYQRLEYKKFRIRGILQETWSNLNLLIRATHLNNLIRVYVYSTGNLEESLDNKYILSMFSKEIIRWRNEGKEVRFMTIGCMSEFYGISYNKTRIKFKTQVRMYNTHWKIFLLVSANVDAAFNKENSYFAEFCLLTDSYTVDDKTLKSAKLMDIDDEEIDISTFMMDVPDLERLDQVLMKNGWIEEITLVEGEDIPDEEMYNVTSINEAFGQLNMMNTVANLIGKQIMEDPKNEDTEEDIMEMVNSPNRTSLFDKKEFQIKELVDALLFRDSHRGMQEVDPEMDFSSQKRTSIIKTIDYLITTSFQETLDIDRKKMQANLKYIKSRSSTIKPFHSMLFWQIRNALDFNISYVMALMIYNVILKNYITVIDIQPISKFKIFPPSTRSKIKEEAIYVFKKLDMRIFEDTEDL
ncbi:RNA-dependent RNA polymerase [Botrytis cinerea negative-stranded RNA virus 6]|nr:RNA-dependent RNA polymerase [Botrytis cinerea negative-stranded RNA virus 6]